jgi:hypothetical protein
MVINISVVVQKLQFAQGGCIYARYGYTRLQD